MSMVSIANVVSLPRREKIFTPSEMLLLKATDGCPAGSKVIVSVGLAVDRSVEYLSPNQFEAEHAPAPAA